jgi:hypothetical protein
VHGTLDEQLEDGRTDVTAPATGVAASTATATTGAAAETGAEARAETGTEAETRAEARTAEAAAERTVMAYGLFADMIAELTSSPAPLLVQGPTIAGAEAETEAAWAEGWIGGCEWGVHI